MKQHHQEEKPHPRVRTHKVLLRPQPPSPGFKGATRTRGWLQRSWRSLGASAAHGPPSAGLKWLLMQSSLSTTFPSCWPSTRHGLNINGNQKALLM